MLNTMNLYEATRVVRRFSSFSARGQCGNSPLTRSIPESHYTRGDLALLGARVEAWHSEHLGHFRFSFPSGNSLG